MKLGIMQPYFFPYIGYWQLLNAVDKYVICDDVNFIKGGWINRNRILVNGQDKMIALHMHGASQNKLINEIEVSADNIHKRNLLKTVENYYKKAPCFSMAFPVIEECIINTENNLARFLEYSIRQVCKYLSIETEIYVSSSINKNNVLRCQDKVIEICKIFGADEYFNAIGGQKLYCYGAFAEQGIKLKFLKTGNVQYKQFNNTFIPNLSIIDVMMFNSKDDLRKILNQYELLQEEV